MGDLIGDMVYEIRIVVETILLIFIIFKLTGVITWSWWFIFSPILLPILVGLLLFIISFIDYRRQKVYESE